MRYSIIGATVDKVKSVGGTNIKEAKSTGIIFATLTEEQAAKLKTMNCQVTPVGDVNVAITPPPMPPTPILAVPTYSPKQLVLAAGYEELRSLIKPPLYGSGFHLAIIGSGIRETHEQIGGRVVYRKNYTSSPMEDTFNHETGVCSIALVVAPLCNILNLKVLNDKGSGTEEEVVLAIDDCIAMRDEESSYAPQVINLSLGSPDDGNPNNPLRVTCRAAIERGIWIFAAAGNSGPNPGTILSPACEKYVCAAGSTGYEPFAVSNWSSRGPTKEGLIKPDAALFGENIVMASSASDTATVAKSGTSFAAPFASGLAIITREAQFRKATSIAAPGTIPYEQLWTMTVKDLIDKITASICIKPQGIAPEKDNDYGYGMPFGPYISQIFQLKPAVDIASMMPIFAVMMMMGMIMPMAFKEA